MAASSLPSVHHPKKAQKLFLKTKNPAHMFLYLCTYKADGSKKNPLQALKGQLLQGFITYTEITIHKKIK